MRRALLVAVAFATACASAPRRPAGEELAAAIGGPPLSLEAPRGDARAGLEALLRGDPERARARFTAGARDRDPWAHAGLALLARRDRLPADEARALLAVVADGPGHVLAPVALRRLERIAEEGGARARAVEAGLAPLQTPGRAGALEGLAAYRARVARIRAAEALGDSAAVIRLRAENGSVDRWSLSGPWSAFHGLEFDRPFPPEAGPWPEAAPAAAGLPPRPTRTIHAPDGTFALDGEPPLEDVYYLAADATLARGGRYLVSLGGTGSVRLFVDGVPVAERNHFVAEAPALDQREVSLEPGVHRLLLKVARGATRGAVQVALARLDGAPSDATYAPAAPGSSHPAGPGTITATPLGRAEAIAAALAASAGNAIGVVLGALDAAHVDPAAARRLLDGAVARAPKLGLARALRAQLTYEDPTIDPGVARARAEADFRAALALDEGDLAARAELAALLAATGRLDDAEATLAAAPPAAAARPAALLASARVADARGFVELAGSQARAALDAGAGCDALLLALGAAEAREALAERDDAARRLAECPGGRERLAQHHSARGAPRAALEALAPLAAARPWSVEAGFARAAAHVAAGEPGRAVEALLALAATWPRSARVAKRLADAHELAGDAAAARKERERALRLDPADLALRRALALEDGTEVLAAFAEDARAAIRAYERSDVARDGSSAMVLDAAAIEIHPGGAATERVHQVIHVLDPTGVDEQGEVELPADADVLAVRTLKRDGRALEPDPVAAEKGAVSLAGLEPGDYVQVEWVRSVGPRGATAGYQADPFFFQVAGTSLFRSSYVVVAPRGLGLGVDAKGMEAPEAEVRGDVEVVRAVRTEVPAFVPEPSSPPLRELLPYLHVGVGGGRDAFAAHIADNVLERLRPSEELRAFAREIRAAAGEDASAERLARAAWRAVAARVRGTGLGLDDDASVILSRGRGGRFGVLAAVLAELGFEARLVAVRPFTSDPRPHRFPGVAQYTQLLVRARKDGETFWLDPSQRLAPFGALHPASLDAEGLVLPRPGEPVEVIRTPARPRVEDRRTIELDVRLDAAGSAEIRGVDRYDGWSAGVARGELEKLEPAERARAVEAMLARTFRGLAVESVEVEAEEDPDAPLVLRWRGRVPALARVAGDALVLDAPIHPARLAGRFVRVGARRTPLLVAYDEHVAQTIRITPPEGFRTSAGAPVALEGVLGAFSREERLEGARLVREERLALRRGRHAPDVYLDVAAFAAAVDGEQERPVAFTR